MLFSSLEFLYLFLPLTAILYFLSPRGGKNYILLLSSLLFYGIAKPSLLPLLLGVCLFDYTAGLIISGCVLRGHSRRANALTALTVTANMGVLFAFKYLDPLLSAVGVPPLGIELPSGISFYTFQALSYVLDVRRRAARAQKDPLLFVTYVSLFPQLVAGPIVRYCEVESTLRERSHSIGQTADGLRLFSVGLAKKVLLADGAAECWERLVGLSRNGGSVLGAWLGVIFFAFRIYFDFSGYSDMARGLGLVFGFEFPVNFNYPYTCRSITDFWRRWHITLSSWFKEYLYIPLGGNRKGRWRTYFNLLVTWLFTGIWHGAAVNFLLWGLYFFAILVIEKAFLGKLLNKAHPLLCHSYSLILILVGWLIFASDGTTLTAAEGLVYFGQMLGVATPLATNDALFELLRNLPYLALMTVASTPLPKAAFHRLARKHPSVSRPIQTALALLSLLLSTAYLTNSAYSPFLYFQF